MPTTCSVSTCTMNFKISKREGLHLSYFSFPRDEELCKIWVEKCKRKDPINTKTARICSIHFSSYDFERDFKAELLNTRPMKKLKPGAIPTLNLPPKLEDVVVKMENFEDDTVPKYHKRPRKEQLKCIDVPIEIENDAFEEISSAQPINKSTAKKIEKQNREKEEYVELVVKSLRRENERLKTMLAKKNLLIEKYKSQIQSLKRVQCKMKKVTKTGTSGTRKQSARVLRK